jgi:hypothetical protein
MKKYYDLESQCDIAGLEQLHYKLCLGIAQAKLTPTTRMIPHYEQNGEFSKAVDYKNSEIARIAAVADDADKHLTPDELIEYNKLTYVQKRNVLELYRGGFRDGDFVRLKMTRAQYLSDKYATFYDSKTEWVDNHKLFPELVEWIHRLPFIEIGRVLIFITHQYMHSDMHYDRRDVWADGRHHFIWFNPHGAKKFFLVDGHEKEYINSKAAFFDTSYLHGAEPSPTTTYTLRVDGQLSKEFCERNGIQWSSR